MSLTTVQPGMLGTPQPYNFKNRIINGAMQFWQHGTSGTAASYGYPSADRWAAGNFQSTTLSQSSSVPNGGFQYSLKVQKPAGSAVNSAILAMQTIESNNCYDLSGQVVTLSFWAKAGANYSASGSYLAFQLGTGTVADQGGNYPYYSWTGIGYGLNSTVNITTTWTKYTFTSSALGAGVLEAFINFYYTPTGTAGADDAFYITGVQLEKGVTATDFDYRPYTLEQQLCLRYFYASPAVADAQLGSGFGAGSTTVYANGTWPVVMRTSPTISYQGSFTGTVVTTAGIGGSIASLANLNSSPTGWYMQVVGTGTYPSYAYVMIRGSTSFQLTASAEL